MALVQSSAKDMDRSGVTLIDHLFASAWKYFRQGDMDAYHREVARGLVNYSAAETRQIMRKPSAEIEAILGYIDAPELIHRDNLVLR